MSSITICQVSTPLLQVPYIWHQVVLTTFHWGGGSARYLGSDTDTERVVVTPQCVLRWYLVRGCCPQGSPLEPFLARQCEEAEKRSYSGAVGNPLRFGLAFLELSKKMQIFLRVCRNDLIHLQI